MGFSKEAIRDALTWNGSSADDDNGCDWAYDVLEQADPALVAKVKTEIAEREGIRPAPLVDVDAALRSKTKKVKPTEEEEEAAYRKYLRSMPFHFIQD